MSTHSCHVSEESFTARFGDVINEDRLAALLTQFRQSPAGVAPRVPGAQIIMGMTFHSLLPSGLLSSHIKQLTGHRLGDSSISQRRETMGSALFLAVLEESLGTTAQPTLHPQAFYKGKRLVGVDGTSWSITNTPSVKAATRKIRSRRGSSAFYKLGMTALYELGTHNPLAANVGKDGESEMALAIPLLSKLQPDWLLVADRYYGVAKFVSRLLALPSRPSFLLRARDNLKSHCIEILPDGSRLIDIRDVSTNRLVQLREIYARVRTRSGRWVNVRLWTDLLDHNAYPAEELVCLYGSRWEHETAYKQLKVQLRRTPLLLSHTLTTAVQEICCLLLAQAIIARMRVTAAGVHQAPLQISFIQTLHHCRSLWMMTSEAFRDIIPPELAPRLLHRILELIAQQHSPPRRQRSCPRALRQPVSSWPRLRKNASCSGTFQIHITRNHP